MVSCRAAGWRPAFSTTHAAPKHPPEGVSRLDEAGFAEQATRARTEARKEEVFGKTARGMRRRQQVTAFDPCFRAEVFQIYPQGRIPALQHCRNHPLGQFAAKGLHDKLARNRHRALGSPGNELNHPFSKGFRPIVESGAIAAIVCARSTQRRTWIPCSLASCLASRQHTPISPKLSTSLQKMSHTLCVDESHFIGPSPGSGQGGWMGLERMWVSASNLESGNSINNPCTGSPRPSQEPYEQGQGLDPAVKKTAFSTENGRACLLVFIYI